MIINIHGFKGSRRNGKYEWLERTYDDEILSLGFDYERESPRQILSRLVGRIKIFMYQTKRYTGIKNHCCCVVGTSLGGFFGYALNHIFPAMPTVLFNPSLVPFVTLGDDDMPRPIRRQYVEIFRDIIFGDYEDTRLDKLKIFFGVSDERIDYKKLTIPFLPPGFKNYHEVNQGHHIEMDEEISDIIVKNEYISSPLKAREDLANTLDQNDASGFDDPLFAQVVRFVIESGMVGCMMIQKEFRIGFSRASRILKAMEDIYIIGRYDGKSPREVLIDFEKAEKILEILGKI